MIGRLRGLVLEIDIETGALCVDVSGIGYEVEVSSSVLAELPQTGTEVTLFTHFVVREDAQLLFGFASKAERDLFRAFIKISGVGPKLALALISTVEPATLTRAVRQNDTSVLTRVPGVGKKTAERLMVELKNRVDELAAHTTGGLAVVGDVTLTDTSAADEAEGALIALGYRPPEASRMVTTVTRDAPADLTAEDIIRRALRAFAQANNA